MPKGSRRLRTGKNFEVTSPSNTPVANASLPMGLLQVVLLWVKHAGVGISPWHHGFWYVIPCHDWYADNCHLEIAGRHRHPLHCTVPRLLDAHPTNLGSVQIQPVLPRLFAIWAQSSYRPARIRTVLLPTPAKASIYLDDFKTLVFV